MRTSPIPLLMTIVTCAALLAIAGCGDDDDPVVPADPWTEAGHVFVDAAVGSADGAGTRTDPLAAIEPAIILASAAGKDVCVAAGVYAVSSSLGGVTMAPTVSVYGGFANDAGAWTRDLEANETVIRDLATAGGTFDAPRAAVECTWGFRDGPAPVLDGFTIEGGGGDRSCGVFVSEGTSLTVRHCNLVAGPAAHGVGLTNWSGDRDSGTLVTIEDCTVSGGGGAMTTGIYVSRGDLVVRRTVVSGLTATNTVFGIDCGYGDVVIADSQVDGGTCAGSTRALYLNEAFTSTVSGCTVHGGRGGMMSCGLSAMDTEDVSSITGNTIDAGEGQTSIALELGWVEVNPAVDGNVLSASGGTDRYGVVETSNESDPVSFAGNTFAPSLLAGTGTSVLYRDYTANGETLVTDIDEVNALDENGLNPAGTVHGNVMGAR